MKVHWSKFKAIVTPSAGNRDGYISQHVSYRYACHELNQSLTINQSINQSQSITNSSVGNAFVTGSKKHEFHVGIAILGLERACT